ncbi:MAG: lysophospholipid acyltransferase family protein [Chloroflexi bacterium]|nr:lysophospholipid acyltransferase family protein [Chloroflexota bacterium]
MTLRIFADYSAEGVEHVPPMGPLIVVANHQSNIDPPLLASSLPRRIRFLAKDTLFGGPVTSWFLRSYGAFPLNREGADVRAFRWALNELQRGQVLALFPEGTRSPGAMRKAQSGVVQLALKSQASLLPVGITGTEGVGHWLRVLNPTGTIRVRIGTAFSLPPIDGRPTTEVLDSMTDMVMRRVAALLPESYHGVYGRQHTDGAILSSP